ncbi:MAG: CoA-binding protein [Candidatus Bathyarchaeota archaeon]|nr:CoA-binding protein [Candidatus Termiticorpusculum sp.]
MNNNKEEEQIKEILTKYQTIAIVGLSNTIGKPSHRVAAYLKQHNYYIIPVNPTINQALGSKSYKNLLDIPPKLAKNIEIVDIFRKSTSVLQIVDETIELKKRYGQPFVVWLQLGIQNEVATETAKQAGLTIIMDKCLMEEHMHLFPH